MTLIFVISILAQLVAIWYALKIIRSAGRHIAWIFVILALLTMVMRRSYILFLILSNDIVLPSDFISEIFACVTSVFMAIAMSTIAPLFISTKHGEQYYLTLLQNSSDLITILNVDGTIRYKSLSVEKILGYTQDELIGKNPFEFIHPDDIRALKEIFKNGVLHPGYTTAIRYRFRHKNGSWKVFEGIGRNLIFNSEIYGIVINSRDVTEKRKAEEVLEGNEKFLKSVFSSIQDGISILDKDMNIMRVNTAIERWYGHAMPLVGKKCYEAYHGRNERCKACPSFQTLVDGKASYEVVPKTGPEGEIAGWLDLYSFPLIDKDTGSLAGVIEYVRDISDRKKLEQERENLIKDLTKKTLELETAKSEIEEFARDLGKKVTERAAALKKAQDDLVRSEKLAILGKIAASLSHEIRNPLSVIKNAVYYLKMTGVYKDIKKETEYLDMIKRHVEIADRIISNTLDFTRPKGLQLDKGFINDVIDNVLFSMEIGDNIKVEKNYLSNDYVWIDKLQIGQALFNIIANGIEAIKETGVIKISTETAGDFVVISIVDDGIGIKEEDMAKIFEPLYTTKPMGIGLGLDIVKNIVEKHNGNINIESKYGNGTKFVVNIPKVK